MRCRGYALPLEEPGTSPSVEMTFYFDFFALFRDDSRISCSSQGKPFVGCFPFLVGPFIFRVSMEFSSIMICNQVGTHIHSSTEVLIFPKRV
jgi:hypothetical protein